MPVSSFGRAFQYAVLLVAGITPLVATAQSTWLPTSGSTAWTTGTAWSNGIIPSAVDAVAVFPAAAPTILLDDTTVTIGTINQTTVSGNVVIGTTGAAGSSTDWIDLAVSSGVPIINVTGGNLYMYAQLSGSQGLRKNGSGVYSPRYNTLDFTYTGTNTFGGGTIQIARDGQLGDATNPIEVVASSVLQNWGPSWLTMRPIAITTGTLTIQNGATANSASLGGPISGGGSLVLNTGNFSISNAASYTGATTIRSATVALSGGALLSSAALTLQTSATNNGGSLVDFGGGNQTVSSLAVSLVSGGTMQVVNTLRNGTLVVTGGNLNVNSGAGTALSGTTQFDLKGLSGFSWGNGFGNLVLNTTSTVASGTVSTIMSLPTSGSASLSAAHVQIANSSNGPASSTSTLNLGLSNSISTGTLTVGAYRGNGVMAFAPEVAGGNLVLRGSSGGDSRVDNVYLGFKSGGDNFGNGVMDVTSGSIDARVTNFTVGHYYAFASAAQSSTFAMTAGSVDAITLSLGVVAVPTGTGGAPVMTNVFNQSGGLVRTESLVFGANATSSGTNNNPSFRGTYNLTGGTLAATAVTSGTGFFAASSQRRIAWSGGTITTLSGSSDLVIAGTSGSGGSILLSVSGADAKSFDVPVGRTATLGSYVTLSGSDAGFTKTGAGTLVIGGSAGFVSTYSGSTTVQGGVLRLADGSALPSSKLVPVAGGTVALSGAMLATAGGLAANAGGLTDVGSGLITVAAGLAPADMLVALNSGRGDGTWNGTSGITSSQAQADLAMSIPRSVGWLDNGDGSVTFGFAAPGDTNLDWQIDILDAANFLAGGKFDSGTPATWNEGDFGYDGVVDILDAADFLSTGLFDTGAYNPSPGLSGGVAAVPEPGSFALMGGASIVAGLAALRRQRSKRVLLTTTETSVQRRG